MADAIIDCMYDDAYDDYYWDGLEDCGPCRAPEVGDTWGVDCRQCGEPLTLTFNKNGKWAPTGHQCPALLDLLPDLTDQD